MEGKHIRACFRNFDYKKTCNEKETCYTITKVPFLIEILAEITLKIQLKGVLFPDTLYTSIFLLCLYMSGFFPRHADEP